jgi:subtilase family serine protease
MLLLARGVSIFVASGDDGVGCDDSCDSFEVSWMLEATPFCAIVAVLTRFLAQFPYPSSPYITLVGGTDVYKGKFGR